MKSRLEDDGAVRTEEESSTDEGERGQDEFLTGRQRLPFFEGSDEETNSGLEDSDNEEEE